MANKQLFQGTRGRALPATTTKNRAGGTAYEFGPEHALAQLAATGTFNDKFYGKGIDELQAVKQAADQVSPLFLAQAAVYARTKGHMKDMPAALCVMLSKADAVLLDTVFDHVIDNARMLRNFVQLTRSGQFGRKSLGSGPKRLVRRWLAKRSDKALFRASVGNDPSLADIVKLARPKPGTEARRAYYGYLLGKEHDSSALPEIVQAYEAFKKGETSEVPDVEFRMLTSLPLTKEQWADIARRGWWHQTRMNLNTYKRQGVFDVAGMTKVIADKLRDAEQIRRAKVFPHQLLMAYMAATDVPFEVREALQDAMEVAVENIPKIEGRVFVFPDISGSMGCPVTGHRRGATTQVSCRMVAALIASAFLRTNKNALILPFHNRVQPVTLNPRDSVVTNAEKLAKLPSGGTSCSAPLAHVNRAGEKGDLIIYVSDNESWCTAPGRRYRSGATGVAEEWEIFKRRNPKARMVCLDLAANTTTQAQERDDIMNIGGLDDSVFTAIGKFARGETSQEDASVWVSQIKAIDVNALGVEG